MKTFAIKTIVSMIALVGLVAFVEFGFELRSWLVPSPQVVPSGSERILVIGDSVTGFLSGPGTLANEIRSQWNEDGSKASFDEITRPGLLTEEVLSRLPEKIESFRPTRAIVMIGRSDFGRAESQNPFFKKLSNLHVGRFLAMIGRDLKMKWIRRQSAPALSESGRRGKSRHEQIFDPPWKLYGELAYSEAIPLFEAALTESPNYENGIRALYQCYVEAADFARGVEFFRGLERVSRQKSLLEVFIAALRIRGGEDPARVGLSLDSIEGARLSFKTRMWFLFRQKNDSEFRRLLAGMTVAENAPRVPKAVQGLREIAEILRDSEVQTVFLSYPTDHVDQLRQELEGIDGIQTYDLRSWLLEAPVPTYRYFEEDIEHLSGVGARAMAARLVRTMKK